MAGFAVVLCAYCSRAWQDYVAMHPTVLLAVALCSCGGRIASEALGQPVAAGPSADSGAPSRPPCVDTGAQVLSSTAPYSLTLDATRLFWADDVAIQSMDKVTTAITTLVQVADCPCGRLAVDEQFVYFLAQPSLTSLLAVPKTGGSSAVLAQGLPVGISGLAVDDTSVYLSSVDAGTVLAVAKTGGPPTTVAQGSQARLIGVDASNIYWTTTVQHSLTFSSTIGFLPKRGGATTIITTPPLLFGDMTMDADRIYFTGLDSSQHFLYSLYSVPKSGGQPLLLASDVAGDGLAVDMTAVYFDVTGYQLASLPLAGGSPSPLPGITGGPRGFAGVAVDDAWIYWGGVWEHGGWLKRTCK